MDCYIWYSEEQPRRAEAAPSPLLTVPNVTANPPTASILTSCGTVTLLCTLRVKREKEIDVTVDGLQRVNLLWLKVYSGDGACRLRHSQKLERLTRLQLRMRSRIYVSNPR